MKNLTRFEQETIINFCAGEDFAFINTTDPVMIKRYDKLCDKSSIIIKKETIDGMGEYKVPKKCIKVTLPRQLSEDTKSAMALRAKNNLRKKQEVKYIDVG